MSFDFFSIENGVVLTDGENNSGVGPLEAARTIFESNGVTILAVTFTPGADQDSMQEVAGAGKGRHCHANDGSDLVNVFAEIANNLPAILTE
ncbi:VWA domain-containing protein [Mariniblastus sp.]|nr:VWA domain-containing protein [Mariniblastus sp.]